MTEQAESSVPLPSDIWIDSTQAALERDVLLQSDLKKAVTLRRAIASQMKAILRMRLARQPIEAYLSHLRDHFLEELDKNCQSGMVIYPCFEDLWQSAEFDKEETDKFRARVNQLRVDHQRVEGRAFTLDVRKGCDLAMRLPTELRKLIFHELATPNDHKHR